MIAFIPAKGVSERIPGKNLRPLKGHPLVAYTIAACIKSGVFEDIYVAGDTEETIKVAGHYGAKGILRPLALPEERDIEWVQHCLRSLSRHDIKPQEYAIVRCTSPFRSFKDIREATRLWNQAKRKGFTSLRAVEKCSQHPAKMWRRLSDGQIVPVLLQPLVKWHDSPYQSLPDVYIQNASMEISMVATAMKGSISGDKVYGYLATGEAGFDLNHEYDWQAAEAKIFLGEAQLPKVTEKPWQT